VTFELCVKRSLRSVSSRSVEIITGRERRRRWSIEEKLRIVAESNEAGSRPVNHAFRRGWGVKEACDLRAMRKAELKVSEQQIG